MSSFGGKMNEYKFISIDRFDQENLTSTAYFLSHCHSDHMAGLAAEEFYERLIEGKGRIKLYCTSISENFLMCDFNRCYRKLQPFIHSLPVDDPELLVIPNENPDAEDHQVVVTLLPAAHCPGSVMFLFEGEEGTILYTGDFRLPCGSAARMKSLHDGQSLKRIRSLYLDTTFCVLNALNIPTREQSLKTLIPLVRDWISRDEGYLVHLSCPSPYGYEFLFMGLFEALNQRIHIDSTNRYSTIPQVLQVVTDNPQESRIHACWKKNKKYGDNVVFEIPCHCTVPSNIKAKVRHIRISAQIFARNVVYNEVYHVNESGRECKVYYATHSSLSEIFDFVEYIKPKFIYPNVKPLESTIDEVMEILRDLQHDSQSLSSEMLGLVETITRSIADGKKHNGSQNSSKSQKAKENKSTFDPEIEHPNKRSRVDIDHNNEEDIYSRNELPSTSKNNKNSNVNELLSTSSQESELSTPKKTKNHSKENSQTLLFSSQEDQVAMLEENVSLENNSMQTRNEAKDEPMWHFNYVSDSDDDNFENNLKEECNSSKQTITKVDVKVSHTTNADEIRCIKQNGYIIEKPTCDIDMNDVEISNGDQNGRFDVSSLLGENEVSQELLCSPEKLKANSNENSPKILSFTSQDNPVTPLVGTDVLESNNVGNNELTWHFNYASDSDVDLDNDLGEKCQNFHPKNATADETCSDDVIEIESNYDIAEKPKCINLLDENYTVKCGGNNENHVQSDFHLVKMLENGLDEDCKNFPSLSPSERCIKHEDNKTSVNVNHTKSDSTIKEIAFAKVDEEICSSQHTENSENIQLDNTGKSVLTSETNIDKQILNENVKIDVINGRASHLQTNADIGKVTFAYVHPSPPLFIGSSQESANDTPLKPVLPKQNSTPAAEITIIKKTLKFDENDPNSTPQISETMMSDYEITNFIRNVRTQEENVLEISSDTSEDSVHEGAGNEDEEDDCIILAEKSIIMVTSTDLNGQIPTEMPVVFRTPIKQCQYSDEDDDDDIDATPDKISIPVIEISDSDETPDNLSPSFISISEESDEG